jgi:hypothetical protein
VEGRLIELSPQQAESSFGPSPTHRVDPQEVERISREVMGVGFEELGIEIAQQWGWPAEVVQALRPLPTPGAEQPLASHEFVRGVCTAANRLARELFGCTVEQRAERLAGFLTEWGFALHLDCERLDGVIERTLAEWAELAQVMSLPRPELVSATVGAPAPGRPGARPAIPTVKAARGTGPSAAPPAKAPAAAPQAARPAARRPLAPPRADDPQRITHLTTGIEQLSLAAMSDVSVTQLMQSFMQVLGQALQVQRVLICLRARQPERLEGRLGSTPEATRLSAHFRVPLQPPADLFGLLCLKGSDTLISDTSDPLIAQRLPAWFQAQVRAQSFLLLPLVRSAQVVGMVYADSPVGYQALSITERELNLVKGLRNQVLMALQLREGAPLGVSAAAR